MTKARNTAAARKHVEDEGSYEVTYDTQLSATRTLTMGTNPGLPFFRDTRANINSIVAHPNSYHWVRDFGDRDVLCWEKADDNSRKDIQLITVGEIKTADLEVPNKFGAYTIDLLLDDQSQEAFEQLWKSGRFGNGTGFSVPVNNLGVARFTGKVDAINRDARKKKLNLVLAEDDPFPGLHDGSIMHRNSTALVSRPATDFTAGAMVAVEATVATYDFTSSDGLHRFGYSLGLREVYWLNECREDGDRDNPATPSKKRQAGSVLISPRSFSRLKKVATFDD